MSEQAKQLQKIIARCWSDESFKQRLLAFTSATLKAEGLTVPAGVSVKAVENTAQQWTLVIPPKPSEVSNEALDAVAGGTFWIPRGSYSF